MKINWYNKIHCLLFGHESDKKEINIQNAGIFNTHLMSNFSIGTNIGRIHIMLDECSQEINFNIDGDKYKHSLSYKICKRCGIYSESTLKNNPDYLTAEEKLIKDIIE